MNSRLKEALLSTNKTMVIAVILFVVLSLSSPYFLTATNLLNLLRQVTVIAIVAIPYTLMLGNREIDLSVGSLLGLMGAIVAWPIVHWGIPWPVAVMLGVVIGGALGAANALMITVFAIPSFIVTLATAAVFRGSLYIMTRMQPVVGLPEGFVYLGQGYFLSIPVQIYVMVVVLAVIYLIAHQSKFGRYIVAKGANLEAARIAGIDVDRVRLGVFVIVGACVAIAGILQTARSASAQTGAGLYMEMDVIAAVVIGGTALFGGTVNIIGTLFGVLIIGAIANGLNLLGMDPNFQIIAKGLIILVALLLDRYSAYLRRPSVLEEPVQPKTGAAEQQLTSRSKS